VVGVPVGQKDVVDFADTDAASFEFFFELFLDIRRRDARVDECRLTVTFEKVERVASLELVVF
jgi:hypothetical protein